MSKLWYINQAAMMGGAAAVPWYLAGGLPVVNILAAYQPIGAVNLASSYINLVTPGVGDAALGVAPTWNATDGWIGAGAEYLKTPNGVRSYLIRYSGVVGNGCVAGQQASSNAFDIYPYLGDIVVQYTIEGIGNKTEATSSNSGVVGLDQTNCYFNGAIADSFATTNFTSNMVMMARLAGTNAIVGNVQAAIFTNLADLSPYVADLTARMAALP